MIEVTIASDYRGVKLKEELLRSDDLSKKISFTDIGIDDGSTLDYIDISKKLADNLLFNQNGLATIICGSGHGVAIALNRFTHIRAATCNNVADAINAREKLNANVLCMGSKHVNLDLAADIILAFNGTDFFATKHSECVQKLSSNQTAHHKNGVNLIVRAIIEHQDHILLTTATEDNKNFAQGLFFLPGGACRA
jgi:ribose 5-phosphate isomerase B